MWAARLVYFFFIVGGRYSDWLRAGRLRGRSSSPSRVMNFLFSTSSRPSLGSTQHRIQWGPGALSSGVKRQGREAHLQLVLRSRKCGSLHPLHGVLLNLLSTGTTLPLLLLCWRPNTIHLWTRCVITCVGNLGVGNSLECLNFPSPYEYWKYVENRI
jgi:hypothetical protein